tara:strand:- start:707 stop:1357 length:651 start_codon:yes stop_codon:yes gene_type:complete
MTNEISQGVEAYLKRALEAFEENPSQIVKTSDLAARLNVSSASVTEMIKKLAARNLVTHVPYKGSRLTSEGFLHANHVKRRQMLIEILLSEVVGLDGDLTDVASKMESALERSHEMALDRMLGYPEQSRDGRKIPALGREIGDSTPTCTISEMENGQKGTIIAIRISKENSAIMLKINVRIGTLVQRSKDGFIVDGTEYQVSESTLDSIFVDTGGQ